MFINDFQQQTIKSLALEIPDQECCGLIISDNNGKLQIVPCQNTSLHKNEHFLIHSKDYLKAAEIGQITGIFHSHTDGSEFSELDKLVAGGNKLFSIIYDIKNDSFSEFYPESYTNSYIGREFKIGESDCFSIIREYYKNELNIEINDYFRDSKWFTQMPDLYNENYEKEGFIKIIEGEVNKDNMKKIKVNDLLLFRYGKEQHIDHAAIYIGGELMLHHAHDRHSCIENFDNPYRRRICMVVRHKTLL